ncbi:MAG: AAA family ATPase [Anaerolineae bacterium]|nr:AAA family ATPase [Anaerolineae bacterium]
MSLSLSLLGVFQASLDNRPLTEFYSSKVRALLAYLAVEAGREHPRPVLAALLWPDWDDRAALGNLRFSLSKLRQAIHDQGTLPPFLLIDRDTLQLNPAADVSVDVHLFQRELRASRWESLAGADPPHVDGQSEAAVRAALAHLTTAMDLYRGPFLEGVSVGDSAVFEEWALAEREHLEREARRALHGLTALYQRLGNWAAAEQAVRRLLDMDRWDEPANRRLMAVLAQAGQRNAALRHYAAYQEELASELGCDPEDETQALYAQIRDGGLAQPWPQPRPSLVAPGLSAPERAPPTTDTAWPPRFVAREHELARLRSLLDRALAGQPAGSGGGLALIVGEAGSGKTALLDEFARRASQAHDKLIVLRGSCNAHADTGDPFLPFREILQTLAGDVEGKRAGGTLSLEQARRAWEALPAVGAALVENSPDLIDRFVPGEALLQRVEGFLALSVSGVRSRDLPKGSGSSGAARWLSQLREIVRRAREETAQAPGPGLNTMTSQPDLFGQVTQVLHILSVRTPLLLVIDDLQWADAGTTALLFHLGRRLAGSRILLLCAYRPEALDLQTPLETGVGKSSQAAAPGPQSGSAAGVGAVLHELIREWGDVQIDLDQADGRAFVEAYIDSEPNRLGTGFRQALTDHTAGNPLFTVELLRSLERAGMLAQDEVGCWITAAEPDWERWPPRVEAVIARHMAGLPDEDRALLQAASVQGEQFAAEVVAQVLDWGEEAVLQRLSGPLRTRHRLVEAVSLDRLPPTGQRLSRYRFRHALVQRSAYRSLDAVQRARLHETTARALEAIHATTEQLPALSPELAQHYEAAGLPLEAAAGCLEAGRWAMRLVAYGEAIAHLERGLALLEGVPASRERLRLELALCLALVNPAVLERGFQAPSLKRTLTRLFELGQVPDLRDDPQRLTALVLLALTSSWSADPARGQQVGEQILELASLAEPGQATDGNRQFLMLAHWVLGHSRFLRGQLLAARDHLKRALAFHDPEASGRLGLLFPGEPGVNCHALLGFVLWLLGYPDQGRESLRQTLAEAREIEQPLATAFTHIVAGALYAVLGRDVTESLKHAQALQALGVTGQTYSAWTELLAGQAGAAGPGSGSEQGLAQVAEARSALDAMGSAAGYGVQSLVQAHMLVQAGRAKIALEALDRALAWIERTGVRPLEAEVWRVRGELLLAERPDRSDRPVRSRASSKDEGAAACFQRALEIAREQQARWLELRAAVSLARLWRAQGRHDEARELLAGITGWFTEGFDTVDLVEAKALLEALA